MPTLAFHRTEHGSYRAEGASHVYLVWREPYASRFERWALVIRHAKKIVDVTISDLDRPPVYNDAHGVKKLAVAVAREFEALGDDYRPCDHGYRERATEAVRRAYATTP